MVNTDLPAVAAKRSFYQRARAWGGIVYSSIPFKTPVLIAFNATVGLDLFSSEGGK